METQTKEVTVCGPEQLLYLLSNQEDTNLYQHFKNWIRENAKDIVFEISEMNLPDNVPGFTMDDVIYINNKWLTEIELCNAIFPLIHEIGHAKDFKSIIDEPGVQSSEDFEKFIEEVITIEKRVDNYAEQECLKINSKVIENPLKNKRTGFMFFNSGDEKINIYKQPFNFQSYMTQFRSFMKQNHDFWIENKEKYPTFDLAMKEMYFNKK